MTEERRVPTVGQRSEFSDADRKKIKAREGYCCFICGRPEDDSMPLVIHHVKFRSEGGRGVFTNGIAVCSRCHTLIHSRWQLVMKIRRYFAKKYGDDYYMDKYDRRS